MVWVRMEDPDQTQPEPVRRYLSLEIVLGRDQVTVVPRLVLARVLGRKNLRDVTLPAVIATEQEARSLFWVGCLRRARGFAPGYLC